jgi:alpha-D-ribose 1-methylphosphonate 5-triphosphate diphosphatase
MWKIPRSLLRGVQFIIRRKPSLKWLIENGLVLLENDSIQETTICVEDDRIAGFASDNSRRYHAENLLVLPGIIDIHGDAFERDIRPRPSAVFPNELAIAETDRRIVADGITTSYYALTCTWEPGLRSLESARKFITAFDSIRSNLGSDAKLHLRFEIHHHDAVDEAIRWMEDGHVDLLAFNDHISHQESKIDDPVALSEYLDRTGLPADEFREMFFRVKEKQPLAWEGVEKLAAVARDCGVSMASHDEETPEIRAWYNKLGCTICEFPCNRDTAIAARSMGDHVVLGAPNALKGGSLYERLSARIGVRDSLCTILASDYYYPAQLHAAFLMKELGFCSIAEAWKLVSANPADALGLDDRGRISVGRRADLVLVDDADPIKPRVAATMVAGQWVYVAPPDLLRIV